MQSQVTYFRINYAELEIGRDQRDYLKCENVSLKKNTYTLYSIIYHRNPKGFRYQKTSIINTFFTLNCIYCTQLFDF